MNAPARPWVGGGTIAAVCEVSPYVSKVEAYLEFIGEAPPPDEKKLRFFRGRKRAEGYINETLREEYGVQILRMNERYQDAEFLWAKAELDVECAPFRGATRIESKSADPRTIKGHAPRWGIEEEDTSIPIDVVAQVQWGFGVKAGDGALVVAQIGWDDTRLLPCLPDAEIIRTVREKAKAFMDEHIIPRIPPAPKSVEDALLLFPKSISKALLATPEVEKALLEMASIDRKAAVLEMDKERCSVLVRSFMKDADVLLKANAGTIATYRSNKASVIFDAETLLKAYEAKLAETMLDAAAWCAEQRRKVTRSKPGQRPLRNLLKTK